MKGEQIELVCQAKSEDGKNIEENAVSIFAEKKSITYGEFYAAYGVGIKPKMIFVIHPSEFSLADIGSKSATHVRYKGTLYPIIRAFQKDRFNMELTIG